MLPNVAWGILAGICSDVFFGSFGVPIKSPAIVAAKVDPVIFQFYKATACFLTSWLVLFYVEFKFTYWGLVGAAIWVVNGTLAIIAVQKAGLGVAQALWSGLSIFVSFLWGTMVFNEPVKSVPLCLFALFLMAVGMAGVGLAAAGKFKEKLPSYDTEADVRKSLIVDEDAGNGKYAARNNNFSVGIACAIYVGIANGSFMTPLKYANKEVKGAEYLMSFGIGAMSATVLLVGGYFIALMAMGRPIPSFQTKVAAKPALLTGVLWSAGNFSSIYATQYLGMALGWPLVQCQLIISTMWGVFYYEEITGTKSITVVLFSSILMLLGVVVLALHGL